MKHNEIKKKSLVSKYKFLKSDLEWRNIIVEETRDSFINEVSKKVEDMIGLMETSNESKVHKKEDAPIQNLNSKNVKKTYRDICKITHPDIDTEGIHEDTFKLASLAYNSNNPMQLFEICDNLNIKYLITDEDLERVNAELEDIESQIKNISGTFIFKFNEIQDEKEKEKLIDLFILTQKLKNERS